MALGLRTTAGVDTKAVADRFGVDLVAANAALIDDLRERALLEAGGAPATLSPTLEGMAIADTLAASFRIAPTR